MPFANYKDMKDCIAQNSDKSSPGGYCASIYKKATGKWPSEETLQEGFSMRLVKDFVKKIVRNPIKAAIAAIIIANILKKHK